MKIEPTYKYGDIVYFQCDTEQMPYMVTHYLVYPGELKYGAVSAGEVIYAYDFELSDSKNVMMTTTN